MSKQTLDDRIRVAVDGLLKTQRAIISAITELTQQGYTTQADSLSAVLADLKTTTNNIIDALH